MQFRKKNPVNLSLIYMVFVQLKHCVLRLQVKNRNKIINKNGDTLLFASIYIHKCKSPAKIK